MWQLPEHLIEDILDLILFLTNHHPETLGTSQLYPLMTMVSKLYVCADVAAVLLSPPPPLHGDGFVVVFALPAKAYRVSHGYITASRLRKRHAERQDAFIRRIDASKMNTDELVISFPSSGLVAFGLSAGRATFPRLKVHSSFGPQA